MRYKTPSDALKDIVGRFPKSNNTIVEKFFCPRKLAPEFLCYFFARFMTEKEIEELGLPFVVLEEKPLPWTDEQLIVDLNALIAEVLVKPIEKSPREIAAFQVIHALTYMLEFPFINTLVNYWKDRNWCNVLINYYNLPLRQEFKKRTFIVNREAAIWSDKLVDIVGNDPLLPSLQWYLNTFSSQFKNA